MTAFLNDLAYAFRIALRRPTLTIVTILTLGLGIGGNSAVFSLTNSLFLRPLPVPRPEELVRIFGAEDGHRFDTSSFANLSDLAKRSQTLSALAIHQQTAATVGLGDKAETSNIELVSGSYFATLGVRASQGRMISTNDDVESNASQVLVVSDGWWRSHLGGRSDVVGSTIHLNGSPFTVVGVAPSTFRGSYDTLKSDLWVPLMAYNVVRPRGLKITARGWGWLSATARVRPGVTLAQAQADADRVVEGIKKEFPRNTRGLAFQLEHASAMPESMTGTTQRVLLFALLAAGLALSAACANVAHVQLVSVYERRREIATRLAMGASRIRVARQWITESLLTAFASVIVGTIAGMWLLDGVAKISGPAFSIPNLAIAGAFDFRFTLFSVAVMFAIAFLFGGWPAIRAANVDVGQPLKEASTTGSPGRAHSRAHAVLVGAQVAISVALIIIGTMLTRSFNASRAFDVGFDTSNLTIATPSMANVRFDANRGRAYYSEVQARVRALPGVQEVALGAVVPLGLASESSGYRIDGYSPPDGTGLVSLFNNFVSPNYFDVMRIPIRRGRGFDEMDGLPTAPIVAVVNEAASRTYWPDQNPIGRTIRVGTDGPPIQVVGIVADIAYRAPGEVPFPVVYLPFGPIYVDSGLSFHVRTDRADATLVRLLTRELRNPAPQLQAVALPYEELRAQSLYPGRTLAAISAVFAAIAILLAIIGLYGIMSHVVTARRREFAVRIALGAKPAAMMKSVIARAAQWLAVGLLVGSGLAVLLATLLRAYLFDVSPLDLPSIAIATIVIITVSVIAAYAPVKRALRIDPATVLKS